MSESGRSTEPEEHANGAADTSDREIRVTRILNAPRELVFKVWTDPKHLVQWWGPKGFTITTHSIDVRPGGIWRFVMHGPDGTDYDNEIRYVEIVRPERLVYDHIVEPHFRATAIFEDQGHKTKLSMHTLFDSAAIREMVDREFHAVEGLNQTLDRLEEQLAAL